MSDVEQAAERVRRVKDKVPFDAVYGRDVDDAEWKFSNDIDTLAHAYLAQQPTYAELTAKLAEAEAEREELMRIVGCKSVQSSFVAWLKGYAAMTKELAERNKRLAYFDDPTPLTAQKFVEMLPDCEVDVNTGHLYLEDSPGSWIVSRCPDGNLHIYGDLISDEHQPKTLGAFRRLATGLGIQLKEDV